MGTIVVVPMHTRKMRGLALKTLPLLFHYMNEVKLYSTFFKLKSAQPNFGKTVVKTLIADPGTAAKWLVNAFTGASFNATLESTKKIQSTA